VPHPSPNNESSDPRERAREALRKAGLKSTQPRLAVLELLAREAALSHREICERLSEQFLNPATIFRVLVDLCQANLLRRFDPGDHTWRFERSKVAYQIHPRFMCVEYGQVTYIDNVTLDDVCHQFDQSQPIRQIQDIILKGLCGNCHAD
jgi:Fe2+ or Zn2+ uptake regulation protein